MVVTEDNSAPFFLFLSCFHVFIFPDFNNKLVISGKGATLYIANEMYCYHTG